MARADVESWYRHIWWWTNFE